ncbi:O-antigen ligase family protein [Haloferula sargassicola]|uniref:O-antigen ligase family protein n=1 Tax=Haloferula sargassicola TaxID=490096 RepID=UPI0033656F3D
MEIVKTLLKVVVIAFVYLGIGPALGFLMKGRDRWRRFLLGFMAFELVRPPSDFTLMLDSIETYRGHTKGFEFNFLEAIAIGFALAALLEKRKDFRWFAPGLWVWFLWIGASLVSVVAALEPLYVFMPAFKFAKMGFIFVGVFAALRGEKDVLAMMRGFAIALLVQVVICLWGRYVQGGFRVMGWFEHQNPMAMWSYFVAFPLLALAISKETKMKDVCLFFAAFGAAGLVVVLSVSRASLAAFGVGSALVMLGSFVHGLTIRRVSLGLAGAVGGVLVLAMAADTFMERMDEDSTPENDLRFALNNQSKAMLHDHPLTGIGWNNYGLANSRPRGLEYSRVLERWEENRGRRIYPEMFRKNPLTESLYWLMLAENGVLGFGAFMLFVGVTMLFGTRATFAFWKTPLGLVLMAVTISLGITYLHGQVERVLTQTKNLTTWIIFCALVSRAEWWRRQAKKAGTPKTLPT